MKDNATNEINHHKIEGGDDTQQIRYITWPGQKVGEN